jgi:hypothetical protein
MGVTMTGTWLLALGDVTTQQNHLRRSCEATIAVISRLVQSHKTVRPSQIRDCISGTAFRCREMKNVKRMHVPDSFLPTQTLRSLLLPIALPRKLQSLCQQRQYKATQTRK